MKVKFKVRWMHNYGNNNTEAMLDVVVGRMSRTITRTTLSWNEDLGQMEFWAEAEAEAWAAKVLAKGLGQLLEKSD